MLYKMLIFFNIKDTRIIFISREIKMYFIRYYLLLNLYSIETL